MYSCNFEGNKRSLLYSLLGSVPKVVFSWVAKAPQDIYSCMHMKVNEVATSDCLLQAFVYVRKSI